MFFSIRDFHLKFCNSLKCKYRLCQEQFLNFRKYLNTRNQKKNDIYEKIINHAIECRVSKCSVDYCKKMKLTITYERQQHQKQQLLLKQQQQIQQQQQLQQQNNNYVPFLSIPESNSSLSTQPLPSSSPIMQQQQQQHLTSNMMQSDMSLLPQQHQHLPQQQLMKGIYYYYIYE